MKTLWLAVARGGSKGVPGKNLRRIGDRSLIEWKVNAAIAAGASVENILCSTEDTAIACEAVRQGCMLVRRPNDLATDTASSADVIRHTLDTIGHDKYDQVVLLEPSAPFTTGSQYRKALQMMEFHDADLVVGMRETAPHAAFIGDVRPDQSVTPIILQFQRMARRRQDYPTQWTMAGNIYVFKTDMFLRTGDIYGGERNYGLMTDHWSGLEIDTPDDLEMAQYAYSKGYVTPEPIS